MVEIGEFADESIISKKESPITPMNIYYHEGSVDSAQSSGESSRRNSNPFGDFKDFVKRRRRMGTRYQPSSITCLTSDEDRYRKASADSQFYDMDESDDELSNHKFPQRRFSVPEKDYAILRQSKERRFEIVAAFDRHTDPYRQYMQSLTCYDLAPSHGAIVLIDYHLTIHKALIALSQCINFAALIIDSESSTILGILTITDCLRAIVIAANEDNRIGDKTVKEFVDKYNGRKRLVTAPAHLSVWDAARLFCLNHVHRIPILQVDDSLKETDVLYMLSMRTIFSETILKLVETTYSLAPHVKYRTLQEAAIGTWNNVITVSNESLCSDVIDVFLDGKISCIAVIDAYGKLAGSISKSEIMRELYGRSQNYTDILTVPVREVLTVPPYAHPSNTIFEAIGLLMGSDQQCLFVTDPQTEQPLAAVAFFDIMDYILNSAEIHHKMSIG